MFRDINEVVDDNKAAGQHFFSPDTMRFFGSRVGKRLYGGMYFVTSEKLPHSGEARRYTVRRALPDGGIVTVGEFQQFATSADAVRAIKGILAPVRAHERSEARGGMEVEQ